MVCNIVISVEVCAEVRAQATIISWKFQHPLLIRDWRGLNIFQNQAQKYLKLVLQKQKKFLNAFT